MDSNSPIEKEIQKTGLSLIHDSYNGFFISKNANEGAFSANANALHLLNLVSAPYKYAILAYWFQIQKQAKGGGMNANTDDAISVYGNLAYQSITSRSSGRDMYIRVSGKLALIKQFCVSQ